MDFEFRESYGKIVKMEKNEIQVIFDIKDFSEYKMLDNNKLY